MEAVNLQFEIAVHNAYVNDLRGFGGPDWDRTDDLFHAMAIRVAFSTTCKWVWELPNTRKYLEARGRPQIIGLRLGSN